ncbi:hypothetical protein [Corynebacterium camporealensis]|nr:hypothetical protein [Corynebacterium camporealensis]
MHHNVREEIILEVTGGFIEKSQENGGILKISFSMPPFWHGYGAE